MKSMLQEKFPKTPVYSALRNYAAAGFSSFHTPGHKNGKLFKEFNDFAKNFSKNIFSLDLSVSVPEIDSLHEPGGVIKESLKLAAKSFNSDKTFFVVGGSTIANLVSIFSVFSPNDKIIVSRNLHKSVWAAILLRNLKPVFMPLEYKKNFPLNVSTETVISTLEKNSDAKGVLVSSPSYDGITANIKEISNTAHSFNIPLLVDEAWGAHFHFSEKFPSSAMDSGADLCVQSTHKVLGALSQSSMLHLKSKFVSEETLEEYYNYFTSTSPFYPFLASLDFVRAMMDFKGKKLLDNLFNVAKKTRSQLECLKNFSVIGNEIVEGTEFDMDLSKITIKSETISGFDLAKELKKDFSLQVEKFDEKTVLFLITLADSMKDTKKIISAMSKIDDKITNKHKLIPKLAIPPHSAINLENEKKPIENCLNRVCAEPIIPYPPGIPMVLPGELITEQTIYSLKKIKENKVEVHGVGDKTLSTIKILKNGVKLYEH